MIDYTVLFALLQEGKEAYGCILQMKKQTKRDYVICLMSYDHGPIKLVTLVTLENQAFSLLKGTMSQRTGLQTNFECCVFHLLGDKSIRLSTRVFAVSP